MTTLTCWCRWHLPSESPRPTELEVLKEAEHLSQDPDWRVREWVAQSGAHGCRHLSCGLGDRWEALRRLLCNDPHPHVRSAAEEAGARGTDLLLGHRRRQAALELFTSGVPMTEDEVLGWRCSERLAIAQAGGPNIPIGLLGDPHCDIRSSAVETADTSQFDTAWVARLRADLCPRVRAATLQRFGPDPAIPLENLSDQERSIAARTTHDPALLAILASDPCVDVRLETARNPSCPAHLLVVLARHPVVFGAALANPSWPEGIKPPDPFASPR